MIEENINYTSDSDYYIVLGRALHEDELDDEKSINWTTRMVYPFSNENIFDYLKNIN